MDIAGQDDEVLQVLLLPLGEDLAALGLVAVPGVEDRRLPRAGASTLIAISSLAHSFHLALESGTAFLNHFF